MSDQSTDHDANIPDKVPDPNPAATEKKPAPKRRRRRWPWIVLGVVVFLLLLVILAPTIASSGWARSIAVGVINKRLNGRAEIKDWSLGWNSGIAVDGLVIFDEHDRQVLQLPHFRTGLTVLDLLRGRYHLGRTEVDGLDVLVSREPDGSINWQHIVRSTAKQGGEPASESSSAGKQPTQSKLPDVNGELVLNQCRLTYEEPAKGQSVNLRQIQADIKIPDINQPIDNTLTAETQFGTDPQKVGGISLNGSIAAIKNNVVSTDTASGNETFDLRNLDVSVLPAVLAMNKAPKLSGRSDGHLAIVLNGGAGGSIQANLGLKGVSLASGEGTTAKPVLTGYDVSVATTAKYSHNEQSTSVKVDQLDVHDNQRIIALTKGGQQVLTVAMPASAANPTGGSIHLYADLKRLNDVMQALAEPTIVAEQQNGTQLKSGVLQGELAVAQASVQQARVTGNLAVTGITVGGATTTPIENETLTLALDAVANQDLSQLNVSKLDAAGSLITAKVTEAKMKLSNGSKGPPVSMFEMLQNLKARIDVPSLPKVQMVFRAFSPAKSSSSKVASRKPGPALAAAGKKLPAGAVPTASTTAELPPADITSGSATAIFDANNEGGKLHLVPNLTLSNLAVKRGQLAYDAGNINFTATADVTPAARSGRNSTPTMLEQIGELQMSQLHVSAPSIGGADVSLVEPVDINDPGGLAQLFSPPTGGASHATTASATGRVLLRGDPGPALALKDTLAGQPSTHQIGGGYAIDVKIATDPSGTILANSRADLNDLKVDGETYPEKAFRLLTDAALNGRTKVLDLRSLTLAATSTNSLSAVIKGRITDLGAQQKIDNALTATITYDADQAWKMVVPLLSKSLQEKLKDSQAAGHYTKQFRITGAYPAGDPKAIEKLQADGDLQIDKFQGAGVNLLAFAVPVTVKDGIVRLVYAGKPEGQNVPAPAGFNSGTLSLGGCQVDLRGDHMLVTTPANLHIVQNATLNPVFAAWSLGDLLNNPAFVGATTTTGILNINIAQCDRVPMDSSFSSPNDGKTALTLSIKDLNIGNPTLEKVADALRLNLRSFRGDVTSYQITIANGITEHNLVMDVGQGKRPLRLFGKVNMQNNEMLPVTIDLPWKLFGLKGVDQNVQKFLPEGVQIPLRGKVDNPQFSVDINKIIGDATQNAFKQGLLKGVLNQGNNSTTQPADNNPLNQIEGLINGLQKKPKK